MVQAKPGLPGPHEEPLMNGSINRVGLAIAVLAVVVTVGGVYVADGYLSAQGAASVVRADPSINDSSSPSATASLPPELVYVRPAPSPKIIHVTRAAPPRRAPRIVHVRVSTVTGEGADSERDTGAGD